MTAPTAPAGAATVDHHAPATRRARRSWYWYDWANSAYVTTTSTVLIGPYLTAVARRAACPGLAEGAVCEGRVSLLGLPVAPGSLVPYLVTLSTIVSVVVLLVVGAVADRSTRPVRLLGLFAWAGALAASGLALVHGDRWQLGAVLLVVANTCLAASAVVYDALLTRVADADRRDAVSSRGWALGYLGGGLLLALNLVLMTAHESLGLGYGQAIRLSLLSAGVWWAVFTLIPVIGLWHIGRSAPLEVARGRGSVRGALAQLADTLRDVRRYPQTLLFLLAALCFNDGIQTVIGSASLYGSEELGFTTSQLIITILLVQFVAFVGALAFGAVAARVGAKRTVLGGLVAWSVVCAGAYLVPRGAFTTWLLLGVGIGLVLGGTQALARSMYSQLVPRGRESEYFSLYQALERGTSWFGTLLFGLTLQLTGSYRLSIIALVLFFVVGFAVLSRVDMRRGIEAAGNKVPAVL